MKNASLIAYSHHTFKDPKIVIVWIDKDNYSYINEYFDNSKRIISKLEGLPSDEIILLDTEFLGSSVDTIVSYGFEYIHVFKAHPGDIMYEVIDELPIPIHWLIKSVEIGQDDKVIYKLINNRSGVRKTINSDFVNTNKNFYTRKDLAYKLCEDRRKENKYES